MKKPKPILKKYRSYYKKPFVKRNDYTPGWVYIERQIGTSYYKIGLSRNPKERKKALEQDYGSLLTIGLMWTVNMKWTENWMHDLFDNHRIHQHPSKSGYTEWFNLTEFEAPTILRIYLWIIANAVNFCYLVFGFVLTIMALGLIWSIVN